MRADAGNEYLNIAALQIFFRKNSTDDLAGLKVSDLENPQQIKYDITFHKLGYFSR